MIVIVTIAIFFILQIFIKKTKIGKAMRAVAQNREAAATLGIDAVMINTLTFAIGVGLSGIGGALISPLYIVSPEMGSGLLLKAFMMVIVVP